LLNRENSLLRRRNKIRDFLSTLILLGAMAIGSAWLAKHNEVTLQGQYKIIDGDSLVVKGQEIRLLGIDAPEYRQTCSLQNGNAYECGKQSRLHLIKLARSGKLNCTGWEEDKYQRLLAECRAGDVEINARMVKDGWAVSYGNYEGEEAQARVRGSGVWQGGFDSPKAWRENARDAHTSNWLSKLSIW
jgi:endonuclease YncB( thermonuclease family)